MEIDFKHNNEFQILASVLPKGKIRNAGRRTLTHLLPIVTSFTGFQMKKTNSC